MNLVAKWKPIRVLIFTKLLLKTVSDYYLFTIMLVRLPHTDFMLPHTFNIVILPLATIIRIQNPEKGNGACSC